MRRIAAPIRILLIEDRDFDVRLAQEAFSDLGHAVTLEHAPTMVAALSRIADNGIDAVILDLNLPDAEGMQGFRDIWRQWPDMPIYVLSGTSDSRLIGECAEYGAVGFSQKDKLDATIIFKKLVGAVEQVRMQKLERLTGQRLVALEKNQVSMLEAIEMIKARLGIVDGKRWEFWQSIILKVLGVTGLIIATAISSWFTGRAVK